jgi:hypothetical protein
MPIALSSSEASFCGLEMGPLNLIVPGMAPMGVEGASVRPHWP